MKKQEEVPEKQINSYIAARLYLFFLSVSKWMKVWLKKKCHRFLFLWTEDPPELIVLTSRPRLTCLPLHQQLK
jgi:hypothetical protein